MEQIEVFKKISNHQIEGLMLHRNMMIYYDFLGLRSFKRMHEYHYFKESASNDTVNRYVINHLNRIITEGHPTAVFRVPENWKDVDRLKVSNESRKTYLKQGMDAWHKWETETKEMYQKAYKELCDIGEVASAKKVMQLVCDVDMELKCLERLYIKLVEIDWDLKVISTFEDEMHDKYKDMTKEIGIDIC